MEDFDFVPKLGSGHHNGIMSSVMKNTAIRRSKKSQMFFFPTSSFFFSFSILTLQAARVKDVHPDWTDEDIFQVPSFLP